MPCLPAPPGARAWVRGPAGSTSSPGRLVLWSDFLRGRPAFPDDWRPSLRTHRVNQLSLLIRARVRGPVVLTSYPRRPGPLPVDHRPGPAVPCNKGTSPSDHRLTTLPGDLGLGPRARGFYQLPRATRARVRVPRCRPALPANSGPSLRPTGSPHCPGQLAPVSDCPQVRPAVPGDSGQGPSARGLTSCSG